MGRNRVFMHRIAWNVLLSSDLDVHYLFFFFCVELHCNFVLQMILADFVLYVIWLYVFYMNTFMKRINNIIIIIIILNLLLFL